MGAMGDKENVSACNLQQQQGNHYVEKAMAMQVPAEAAKPEAAREDVAENSARPGELSSRGLLGFGVTLSALVRGKAADALAMFRARIGRCARRRFVGKWAGTEKGT